MKFSQLIAQFVEEGLGLLILLPAGFLCLVLIAIGVVWLWATVATRWFDRENLLRMTAYLCAVIGISICLRRAILVAIDFFWDMVTSTWDSILKSLW